MTTPMSSVPQVGPEYAGRQWHSPATHAPCPPQLPAQLPLRAVPLEVAAASAAEVEPTAARAAADRSQKMPAHPGSHTQNGVVALAHKPRPEQLKPHGGGTPPAAPASQEAPNQPGSQRQVLLAVHAPLRQSGKRAVRERLRALWMRVLRTVVGKRNARTRPALMHAGGWRARRVQTGRCSC